jgi:hypothetical protein
LRRLQDLEPFLRSMNIRTLWSFHEERCLRTGFASRAITARAAGGSMHDEAA